MDDLFSYLTPELHGGTTTVAKSMKRQARGANSFRAAWEPVGANVIAVPGDYRRMPGGAATATMPVSASTARLWSGIDSGVGVLTPPGPAPGIALGEIAQPVVDVATAVKQHVHITPSARFIERLLEILPFALAFVLMSSLVWGSMLVPVPLVIMLLGFDIYWAWRSLNMGVHTIKGYRALKAAARIDWRKQYDAELITRTDVVPWDDVYHMVIIPTYKESIEKLSLTLGKLADSEVAHQKLLVVVAMEEADDGAPQRFEALQRDFGHCFLAMIGTTHPKDIPGEVRGKS